MPRYKEYNETRVTEKAMYQFWLHGYGATSLSVLTQAMKINKFTLYEVFESKENLLVKTMEHYYDHFFLPCLEELQSKKDIMEYLMRMLRVEPGKICGCYILTITAETGQNIPEAVSILHQYLSALESTLKDIVHFNGNTTNTQEKNLKVKQLLALCTSVPLMHSVQPIEKCSEYILDILSLMNMKSLGYA